MVLPMSRAIANPIEVRQRVRRANLCRGASCRSRGFTIVELIAALILLGVVFTTSISMLIVVARERRGAEQRQFARQHAANLLERHSARGWSELAPGMQTLAPASTELQSLLPDLDQRVEVTELKQEFNSKLLTVTIRWRNLHGQPVAPVQLSAWVYPLGEARK